MRKSSAIALLLAAFATAPLFAGEHDERSSSGRHREGGLPAVEQRAWRTECSACHIAYHPAFLPERSWRKVMAGLEHHFGENAGLDAATAKQIGDFLAANAADRSEGKRGSKVAASIPSTQTPLRVSETPWFERKHDEIRAAVWKRKSVGSAANCAACHPGAEGNRYDEREIRIPG